MMLFRLTNLIIFVTISAPVAGADKKPKPVVNKSYDGTEILRRAEKIRAPDTGHAKVKLDTIEDKKSTNYRLDVFLAGKTTALVEFLEPAVERGRRMLLLEGQYYAKFRNSKKAVPISRREAVGNSTFALADIFRIQTEDYEVLKVEEEGKNLLRLELKANSLSLPYASIHYYVEVEGNFPVKAKFFGTSGRHLKTLYVEERRLFNGEERASKVRMDDEAIAGRSSWWITTDIIDRQMPKQMFSKEYLVRK